jgi:GTP-binding protein LepA
MLHLEITKERLEREFNEETIVTTPVVAYRGDAIRGWQEPWSAVQVITPVEYIGSIMELVKAHRGLYLTMHYLGRDKASHAPAIIEYEMPLSEIILDFHDQLKSLSQGYASFSYSVIGYRPSDLVELSIFIAGEKAAPFTQLIASSQVEGRGRQLALRLKEIIPRQMFEVSVQAMVGGRIIARENVPAMRKDVTAKLYGGDVTRKRKLLEKQKEGKRKMRQFGRINLPTSVFLEALKPSQSDRGRW